MWNRSSPMSSTAFLIRQVTFLLSSPGLMSPLISKFWAGGLLSRLFLQLLEAADSSGYLSFQKKEEKSPFSVSLFPPFHHIFPFPKSSLSGVTGQCFNTGKHDCVWGEPVWIWVRLRSTCPPSTTHFASLFFHWGSSPAPASPCTINMHCSSFSTCPPHAVARSSFRRAGLRDSYQKHSPTSGTASARSIVLECRCSRVITRAKCTTTSWSCSICKGEQSVSGSIATFPDEREKVANTHERLYRMMVERWRGYLTSKVLKSEREALFPWLFINLILQSHWVKVSSQSVPAKCPSFLGAGSAPSSWLV